MKKTRAIAFYLPQFYPTPENDEWWGTGFTEWTNTARAVPLFRGHYQPHIPSDLGFYDLRLPEVREKQACLAKEAGIEGFCYWHYWFNGKRLLDRVFSEVVESGKPDFPFCLCWANHSWYAKTWDPTKPDKLLMEQTYPGRADYINHFYALLPAFKDNRYIKVQGKLLFGFFAPEQVDIHMMSNIWNELAIKEGLPGFHFWGFVQGIKKLHSIEKEGYDSLVFDPLVSFFNPLEMPYWERKKRSFFIHQHRPYHIDYSTYVQKSLSLFRQNRWCIPCLNPNFDHSPRSGYRAQILHNSTPENWHNFIKETLSTGMCSSLPENIIFIKAWNEWAEGNHLEPDLKFGKNYIYATRQAIDGGDSV